MATYMEGQVALDSREAGRQPYFSPIRWTAIFAGLAGGLASYMLLSLLGVAVGLTAVDPQSTDPVGAVPVATGIWTGISMLVGAFIGGYVSGRMSGLFRRADGMLHGFVAWGSTTLLFAVLMTTALGAALGGTFRILGQTITAGTQVAATAEPSQGGLADRLASIITGSTEANVTPESLASVRQHLAANDREAAVGVMVNEMGFSQERANQIVGQLQPLFGAQGEQNVRDATEQTTNVLSTASWWLFAGLLLSLGFGVFGGLLGARASGSRQLGGEHLAERNRPVVKQSFFGQESHAVPVVNRNEDGPKRR